MPTNFFNPESAARRYIKGRPYFHPQAIERIRAFFSIEERLPRALDVGCGTGLSTIALKAIALKVSGVDASTEMVALAAPEDGIEYCVARAESLPFKEGGFDLVTLSSAFHWLERDKFLKEARRVLRPAAWLIVYDNFFQGQMAENQEFQAWYQEHYLSKYPPPPRSRAAFTDEDSEQAGFRLLDQEISQYSLSFSAEALVDYFVTQSNVIAAVEYGDEEIEDVRRWLTENITPLFGDMKEANFLFQGPIWYMEKQG
jgi:ubiquinone/menaquinone biosynthesis C-methylase UbiE